MTGLWCQMPCAGRWQRMPCRRQLPGIRVWRSAIRQKNAYQRKRMLAIFDQTVWALTRQVRAGQFVPEKFEVTFDELEGKEKSRVPVIA